MGLFDELFGGGQGQGYSDLRKGITQGMGALKDYYNQARGFMNPFLQAGEGELGKYQQGVNAMQDPNAFIGHLMKNYQMSPQAQFQEKQGDIGANAAAAASGQLGSGPEMKQMDAYNQQLANNDRNQYLQQRLGVYNNFLGGAGHLAGMGQGAAGQMGNWGMQAGNALAGMYGQRGQAEMGQDLSLIHI